MLVALVLARVIAEAGSPAPTLDDGGVLLVKRHDVVIGAGCDGVDAGPQDGGVGDGGPADAGLDADPGDAGVGDGGVGGGDAGPGDAGCEVIPGDAVTLMLQPRFSRVTTTGAKFALLMVTPSRPIIETKSIYVFEELASVTAPKVIVHETRVQDPALGKVCGPDTGGCGIGAAETDPSWTPPGLGDAGLGGSDGGYTVDTVGPYEVVRAQPADPAELQSWLSTLGYLTLPSDVDAVAPYITRGYTVVAIRVAVDGTPAGQLSPIALTWAGSELKLPTALGSSAVATTVYIAGPGRFELPGAYVPFASRTSWGEEGFLTRNELVLDGDGNPDNDPIATRVVGDPEQRELRDEYVEKRVPVNDCGDIGCGCGECNARRPVRGDWLIVGGVVALTLRRRRRSIRTPA